MVVSKQLCEETRRLLYREATVTLLCIDRYEERDLSCKQSNWRWIASRFRNPRIDYIFNGPFTHQNPECNNKLQEYIEDLFRIINQSAFFKEHSSMTTLSIKFGVWSINYGSQVQYRSQYPESISSFYQTWARKPRGIIYDAMSSARKMIEEEGLPIKMTSNADGMESQRKRFSKRTLLGP